MAAESSLSNLFIECCKLISLSNVVSAGWGNGREDGGDGGGRGGGGRAGGGSRSGSAPRIKLESARQGAERSSHSVDLLMRDSVRTLTTAVAEL